ncbi:glycerophosphocholine acyltransferase 1-like isoform X2 [Haliotis rufescens]|uniref:glycerophosphocholine acyltransferase 1-like isoform X2 n=1 Tax=Haliotis rufescens TaxID=6454 RepID=UPI00201EB638|nr:glycerophosphocholine acyltransferase 1-like isoform X2 [Haliotis rufescens]
MCTLADDEDETNQGYIMTTTGGISAAVGGDSGQEDVPTLEVPAVDVDRPVLNNMIPIMDRECNGHLLQNGKVHQNGTAPQEMLVTEAEHNEKEKEKSSGKVVKQQHFREKVVFVVSVATVSLLTHSLISAQFLIPYFYSVTAPILLLIRCIMYWLCKWQYFLLDFCYFGNITCYVFIWAFPQQPEFFCVLFALANGPITWALVLFRNSLVFHSFDKTVSIYIHLMPALLSFTIRWYPEETSKLWYQEMMPTFADWSFAWLVGVPLGCFMVHGLFNAVLLSVILKPTPEYSTIYRILTADEKSQSFLLFDMCGPKYRYMMYLMSYWVFCLLSVLVGILWYNYFIAHCIYLSFVMLIATYNGACYYLDVFSVRLLRKHLQKESQIQADNSDVE